MPVFHDESNFKFEIGKGEVLQDGSDVAIIANGLLVNEAIEAGKALKAAGISARIINLCTIKPLDDPASNGRRGSFYSVLFSSGMSSLIISQTR